MNFPVPSVPDRPGVSPSPLGAVAVPSVDAAVPPLSALPPAGSPADVPRSSGARMNLASIGILLLAVALAATGQLLLKNGMNLAKLSSQASGRSMVLTAATSPWILGGLVVFAVSAVAWLVTLSKVPLSIAYPFNALGYVAILVASTVILHERTNLWTWVGTVCVVGGLVVLVTTAPGS
jgi:drug/metabolite transporter (DMT)-like permease